MVLRPLFIPTLRLVIVLACLLGACANRSAGSGQPSASGTMAAHPPSSSSPTAKQPPAQASSVTAAVPAPSPDGRLENERNTIAVFRAAAPATVHVTQKRIVRDWTMRALEVPAGAGTGFVWDKKGHIVTNYHVVDPRQARSVSVTLFNQKSYPATFVGGEPNRDIAVLRISAPPEGLIPIRVLPPGIKHEVGQKTIAIGNPFGLDHTLTTGVISAVGREVVGYGGVTIRDMIQTDASINPGNSGGPLLDSQGRLIGINTMIFSKSGGSTGIGFAVPVDIVRRLVPQIVKTGHAVRVGIGVSILPDQYAARIGLKGVIIARVADGSPAQQAGLMGLRQDRDGDIVLGDVIVGVNEHKVEDYDDLYNALDRYRVGDEVTLKIRRRRSPMDVRIRLVEVK